jgi:hypothetical protein
MKLPAALTALALLAGAGVSHAAQTIVSLDLPTVTNTSGACYLRNVGPQPIAVEIEALLNHTSGFISPSFQNCNDVPLAPGRTCALLVADLPDDVTWACSAVVTGNPRNLRGSIETRANTMTGPKVILTGDIR